MIHIHILYTLLRFSSNLSLCARIVFQVPCQCFRVLRVPYLRAFRVLHSCWTEWRIPDDGLSGRGCRGKPANSTKCCKQRWNEQISKHLKLFLCTNSYRINARETGERMCLTQNKSSTQRVMWIGLPPAALSGWVYVLYMKSSYVVCSKMLGRKYTTNIEISLVKLICVVVVVG